MAEKFSATVTVNAAPMQVWSILTTQVEWMGEPEMQIEIFTDWKVNSPILIRGFHHAKFENKGIVLQYDEGKRLSYSHLSNVSRLPDLPENYTILEFVLTPAGEETELTLNIENFPTEVIRKHLEFYWRTTVFKIKKAAEDKALL